VGFSPWLVIRRSAGKDTTTAKADAYEDAIAALKRRSST